MSFTAFGNEIDEKIKAITTVSTYCVSYISVDDAIKYGVEYTEEDVKLGVLRGVRFSSNNDGIDFISETLDAIQDAWITLGFKDGEFITDRRLNKIYLDYVNNKSRGRK